MKGFISLLLVLGFSYASPAHNLFDEVSFRLSLYYGGPADPGPRQLLPGFREQLLERCDSDPNCPEEVALELIQELIDTLGDQHTNYLPPSAYGTLRLRLAGGASEETFGLVVQGVASGLVVTEVLAQSPAEAAGLKRGDLIVSLDGEVLDDSETSLTRFFDAEAEGAAALVLSRGGETLEVALQSGVLALDRSPSLSMIEVHTALLRIPSFLPPLEVAPSVHALVTEAVAAGAEAFIVDLRDNPGGSVIDCLSSSAIFTANPARVVTTPLLSQTLRFDQSERGGELSVIGADGNAFSQLTLPAPARFDGKVVVLVNRNSASCAEFFALDLQGRALIIGEETYGVADSTTLFLALPGGAGLQITNAQVFPLEGGTYPAAVTPDILLEDDLMALTEGRDVLLEAALSALHGH
jgi:carboxyl-terminal processing protease